MPKIAYQKTRFSSGVLNLIHQANAILAEYESDGLTVTLRQLYYQFVSRGLIENNLQSYKRLAETVSKARLSGLIDWDAIEDRTRNLRGWGSAMSPRGAIYSAAHGYKENLWKDQPEYVEVWVEKDALAGVIEQGCARHRVPYFSCRGYTSQSEVWGAAQRFQQIGKPCHVIHLGDHDPSGTDMTRDIAERINNVFGAANVTINRIALSIEQVRKFNPPKNPAKITDSRASDYIHKFGKSSWELDALDVHYIRDLIREKVAVHVDGEIWKKSLAHEAAAKAEIMKISDNYDRVIEFLKDD